MSNTLEIVEMTLPETANAPDAWVLAELANMLRLSGRDTWGNDDQAYSAEELFIWHQDQEYAIKTWILALDDHRVLGGARIEMPTRGNLQLAEASLVVHPEHRRLGIGSRLALSVEQYVRDHGRSVIIAVTEHGVEPSIDQSSVLTAPTGTGRISAIDPDVIFAHDHGYVFEQVERHSVLELPVGPILLETLYDEAANQAGPDYRLLTWVNRTPDEWVDHLAALETRMSLDAPNANLAITVDPWDSARVRDAERLIAERGRGYIISAVEHIPSGVLAGFTMLEWPQHDESVVFQQDTLVLKEHRGHRIGQWVKAANLETLGQLRPEARRVHTWNAQENSTILAINHRLGFEPAGVVAMWQKHLD